MSLRYIDQEDYTVAIVGGASGIGLEAARFLNGQGVRVAVLDRNKDGVASAAKELGPKAFGVAVDITDWDQTKAAIDSVAQQFGKIDALVNCAAIVGKTNLPTHEVEIENFDECYRINLRGAFLLSKAVVPHMLKRKYGRILHIASIAGKEGNAGMLAYSATKAGLIGLVKVMGKDYAETGITVNGLAPAVIRTPMVAAMPQQQVDYMTAKIPMKRVGELREAAEMIAWIVSPACSFTTGFTFDLTGGRAVY
ncbi:SDR family NAD(P)-dependent oxidoreductase [Dongia sedimenti]|uniref:SDR family oxidoreductase n=1 Tax=Dongia sedimenti TaxID=3064282 RepID=A0ABU0YFZ2_9PROT|nr:SDR family oxidoreductase [Rhodospirillaceae bacterium R-7]